MPLPLTFTTLVRTAAPEQLASSGPYRLNVIVPPAFAVAPDNVAVSEIDSPRSAFADASVEIVGLALPTTTLSSASLQAPETGSLLTSPEYEAIHRYVPAVTGVNESEVAPLPETGFVLVNTTWPVQFASSGPYRLNVIVPVGLDAPDSVAVSEIEPPMLTFADASVEIVGLALPTTTLSSASLQAPETGSLLTSPEYEAIHRYVPAVTGVNESEVAPLPDTGFVLVNTTWPVQFASPGPYRLNVIVPVGLDAPDSVAVSEIEPPMLTFADASVEIVGLALPTTTLSSASLQAPETGSLLTSPEYEAIHRYVPAVTGVNESEVAPLPDTGFVLVNTTWPVQFA